MSENFKKSKQWIMWRYVTIDGKKTKIPYSINGHKTGTSKKFRDTWNTYNEVKEAEKDFDGIGIVFDNGLCGIDIDKRDLNDPIVKDIINTMNTYTEISPSGNGYHLLFTVDLNKIPTFIDVDGKKKLDIRYYQKNPKNKIECYIDGLTNRYFTFTENTINSKPICERTDELLAFLNKYMLRDNNISMKQNNIEIETQTDESIISAIRKSKQNEKFSKLYDYGDTSIYNNDDSSADMGLCCILAYYCN